MWNCASLGRRSPRRCQQAAAQRMGAPTFARIIESARRKTADALLKGKKLRITGGAVAIPDKASGPAVVAVPINSRGHVEAHFGRCERVLIMTVGVAGAIQTEQTVEASTGPGCRSSVVSGLAALHVQALVVGCIGEGAIDVGAAHGIAAVRGASGAAGKAATAYANGNSWTRGLDAGTSARRSGRAADSGLKLQPASQASFGMLERLPALTTSVNPARLRTRVARALRAPEAQ